MGAGRVDASPGVGMGGRAGRSPRQGTVLRRAGEKTRRRRRPRWRSEGAGRRSRPPNRRGPPEMPRGLRRAGPASGVDRPRRLNAADGSEAVVRRPDAVPRAIVSKTTVIRRRGPAPDEPPFRSCGLPVRAPWRSCRSGRVRGYVAMLVYGRHARIAGSPFGPAGCGYSVEPRDHGPQFLRVVLVDAARIVRVVRHDPQSGIRGAVAGRAPRPRV